MTIAISVYYIHICGFPYSSMYNYHNLEIFKVIKFILIKLDYNAINVGQSISCLYKKQIEEGRQSEFESYILNNL